MNEYTRPDVTDTENDIVDPFTIANVVLFVHEAPPPTVKFPADCPHTGARLAPSVAFALVSVDAAAMVVRAAAASACVSSDRP
ncbi:MAG: hypothetical protein ACSLE6_07360 [Mycobacterium sp.]